MLRFMSKALVLSVMIGSSVVVGSALHSKTTTTEPALGETPPAVTAPPEDPVGRPEEPEWPQAPVLPTIEEQRHPSSGFRHPGVLVTLPQLEFVREQVRAGRQPWKGAFDAMRESTYADSNWQPGPWAEVTCGYYSNPNRGCTREQRDALAAYTHAVLWYITFLKDHAEKAIEIIDAWAKKLKRHTGANAPLQAGWSAATFVRAAEIMRYTYPDWSDAGVARAEAMFRDVFLPRVRDGAPRGSEGNWDLIMLDATIGIAVFLDDRHLFDYAVQQWRERLPAYIYLSGDGSRPVGPPGGLSANKTFTDYWHGQTTYVDGLVQETCRDLSHTGWGLEAMAQIAETAWIQGVDLYAEAQPRLVAALEFHAGFALGDKVPGWLCGGALKATFAPIPETAYNHYHHRVGIEMPRTAELIENKRPQRASHFFGWATLTTAGAP